MGIILYLINIKRVFNIYVPLLARYAPSANAAVHAEHLIRDVT